MRTTYWINFNALHSKVRFSALQYLFFASVSTSESTSERRTCSKTTNNVNDYTQSTTIISTRSQARPSNNTDIIGLSFKTTTETEKNEEMRDTSDGDDVQESTNTTIPEEGSKVMEKAKKDPNMEEVVRNEFPYHAKSVDECAKELKLPDNVEKTGLTSVEATARLEKFGYNQMTPKEKVSLLMRIWAQVANVLVGILVFVAIVSAARAATADNSSDVVTNSIQVGLIVLVIT
jgi:magnesium-transporting ATPase (P-type)